MKIRKPKKRYQAGGRDAASKKKQAPAKASSKVVVKTLDRVLSKAGMCSRTEAAEWIRRGRVKVNGKPVKEPEHWVDPERDAVLVDGRPLKAERKIHLLLYKPKGFLTTYRDPEGRPTVYNLLDKVDQWVFPVGRLDQDTSGLLIMTNDTEFAEHVTNPEHHVPKTYLVKASTVLSDEALARLRDGLELKDGMTRPAAVKRVRDHASKSFFEITITEGRNRQVRRMVEALASKVLKLVRVAIGPVRIGKLEIGCWRELERDEVRSLMKAGVRVKGSESGRKAKLGNVPSLLKISFVEGSGCGCEGDFVAEFLESADE